MHIPQKGYAYASKEAALSHRQAGSDNASEGSDNSDADDSDAPQPSGPPGKQLRMPPISTSTQDNDEDSDGYASVSSGSSSSSSSSSDGSDSEDDDTPVAPAPVYPILGARARKRVRPPTSYSKHMAVYVRRCLLTFRHATEDQPDVDLKDEDHAAFQEALREHRVERVVVADSPPPEKASSNDTSPDDVGCVPRPFTSTTSDKEKKRGKKSSKESSAASPLSKKAKIDSKASAPPASTIPSDSTATTSMSTRPLLAAPSSHQAKQTPSDTAGNGPPQAAMTSPRKASSSTVTPPTTSALTSSKHSNSKGASSSSSSGGSSSAEVTDSMSPADKSPVKRSAPMTNSIESSMESSDGRPAPKKPRVADALPPARFQITVNADYKELDRVRRDMNKLQEEGRKLKHEGDRIGRADLTAHGVCYLRASLKFMQQALHASDLKAMYKALNDSTNANHHSKDSTSTLAQTAKLIESAAGLFNKAKDKRKVALSYKFAAIVLLTSYRLQHNMLHLYYKQLPVPSRSPDGSDRVFKPNEEPIRSLLFKEMGTMLQGFEYWKLYEACAMPDVLPTVRDPTTVDLPSLWQALDAELEPTTGSTTH